MAAFRLFNRFRNLSLNCKAPINISSNFKLSVYGQQKFLSSNVEIPLETSTTTPPKKKKTTPIPKVTLLSNDESMQVVTLEEAQKISKRRDLKLVKIIDLDTKTQRPIYKLMTGSEYHAEDLKQREAKKDKKNDTIKGEKLLLINCKISEHDLESRIKNISKWISKKYEVRVVVSGEANNMEACEKIYNIIEEKVKSEGRVLQKRTKGNELKFQVLPPKITKTKNEPANL